MKTRIYRAIFFICLIVLLLSCSRGFSDQQNQTKYTAQDLEHRQKQIEQTAKHWNQQRHFYGKVVDMDGNPLKDVEVEVHTKSVSLFGTIETDEKILFTDKDGRFKVTFKGSDISISSAKKEFYEFSRKNNPIKSISYVNLKHPETSKNKPLVLRLRRRSAPDYLICKSFDQERLLFDWDREKLDGFDLFWERLDENGLPQYTSKKRPMNAVRQQLIDSIKPDKELLKVIMQNEVLVKISPLANDENHEISFQPLDENTGLILSNELLYEAPLSGYESKISMVVNKNMIMPGKPSKDFKLYLYIKGEEGTYFSRVDINGRITPERLKLYLSRYTNPIGSRNLEYNEEYQGYEWKRRIEISKKRRIAKQEARKKRIEFNEKEFMEKIHAEEAEARKNKPLKWWDKLEKNEADKANQ